MKKTYKMKDGTEVELPVAIGTKLVDSGTLTLDEGLFMSRELESVQAKTYDIEYPELMARQLFNVTNEAGEFAQSITVRAYGKTGKAKIINGNSNDLPKADAFGKESTYPVVQLGISFSYTINEVQASAHSKTAKLEQRRANAAVRGIEERLNEIAFNGDSDTGVVGLFSTGTGIPSGNVAEVDSNTTWASKIAAGRADLVLKDINDLFGAQYLATKKIEKANKLLLPPAQYNLITTTPKSDASDMTIAKFIIANSPFLKSLDDIVDVNECSGAGTAGTDRMVIMNDSDDKISFHIPSETKFLAPQNENLDIKIPGVLRTAGLAIHKPLSVRFADGI